MGLSMQTESQEKEKISLENLTFKGQSLSPETQALGKRKPHPHA